MTNNEWVCVTENLPNPGSAVLVYDHSIGIGYLLNDAEKLVEGYTPEQISFDCPDWFHPSISITHWMPLPEPPKNNQL